MSPATVTARGGLTVVLSDDHPVVRSGLRLLLEDAGMRVVAETGDVEHALRELGAHQPDVLVLDLNMPGSSSLGAIPAFRRASPRTGIVVLTMQDDPAYAREALRAGAGGYVLKEAADTDLVTAIDTVRRGGTYLHPSLGARIAAQPDVRPDLHGLTGREAEVLRLVALGHTNGEIAELLKLSIRTVETHRLHIQRKTGRKTRSDLVRYALDHGLVR